MWVHLIIQFPLTMTLRLYFIHINWRSIIYAWFRNWVMKEHNEWIESIGEILNVLFIFTNNVFKYLIKQILFNKSLFVYFWPLMVFPKPSMISIWLDFSALFIDVLWLWYTLSYSFIQPTFSLDWLIQHWMILESLYRFFAAKYFNVKPNIAAHRKAEKYINKKKIKFP